MKTLKKLIISIIVMTVAFIIYGWNFDEVSAATLDPFGGNHIWVDWEDALVKDAPPKKSPYFWRSYDGGTYYFGFSIYTFTNGKYGNVFCAQKKKAIDCPVMWTTLSWSVDIIGDTAYFYYYDGIDKDETPFKIETNSLNNKIAYVTTKISASKNIILGGTSMSSSASGAQHEFWAQWNDWIDECGLSSRYETPSTSTSSPDRMANYDDDREYKATLYYFDVECGEYNGSSNLIPGFGAQYDSWDDGQNIVVRGPDEPEPPVLSIDVTVTKKWDDNKNEYGNRPDSIEIDLKKSSGTTVETKTLTGSKTASKWSHTFEELDKDTTYTVSEPNVPEAYETKITGDQESGFTITNTLKRTSIKVEKTWSDLDNCYDLRPTSVKVKLMRQRVDESNAAEYVEDVTLRESKSWKTTVSELPLYVDGYEVKYWVEEIEPENYTQAINYDSGTSTYKVVNTLDKLDIKVTKEWEDENDYYNNRPESVRVYLYINDVKQEDKYLDLKGPDWTGTFTELEPVEGYTVKEEVPVGYTGSITGTVKDGFTITNAIERTSVAVEKIWDDENNALRLRPATIKISLWQSVNGVESEYTNEKGEHIYKTLRGTNTRYPLQDTFTNLPKYIDGVEVHYTVREEEDKNPGLFDNYMLKEEPIPYDEEKDSYIITNVLSYDGYKEIKGRVWVDGRAGKASDIDGRFNASQDTVLEGIKVTLRDENGNQFDPNSTAITDANGEYTIKVNYDNSREVYKLYEDIEIVEEKLKNSYVEFEYDGMLYTTIDDVGTESLAKEDVNQRTELDEKYSRVTLMSQKLNKITNSKNIAIGITPENEDRQITARTKAMGTNEFINATTTNEKEVDEVTLYCKGSRKYIRTNTKGAWLEPVEGTCSSCQRKEHTRLTKIDVEMIENVNLGLFEREQPEVAIFSDITTVDVEMNDQRYTYKYGVRGNQHNTNNETGLQTKFQNKDTYTYRRPVNPADVAYARTVSEKVMKVYVTYEVKVGNLSSTLPITVHNIINYFDSEYTLQTSGWSTTETGNNRFDKATYSGDLNIRVEPQKESDAIVLRYEVSQDAIKRLLNDEPPLNNAVEIESYSTEYGAKTLYAEQRTSEKEGSAGRAGKPYAGYSFGEHPGNVTPEKRISINSQGRIEIKNQENDEDIAPAFVLCIEDDGERILAGTVWEDSDIDETDDEREGNGYINEDGLENAIENVKVELYNLDGTRADLYGYDERTSTEYKTDAVVTTNENGDYSFTGVVTGEYLIKYTYGNNTTTTTQYYKSGDTESRTELELIDGGTKIEGQTDPINARNYKSTIITDTAIIGKDGSGRNITFKEFLEKEYATVSYEAKSWPLTHTDNYSVAVDNMLDRLAIEDLKYGNYDIGENMTAYTKPFMAQIEFEITGESTVNQTIETEANGDKVVSGEINVANSLSTLDFGIIERPREALIVEKTITNFSVKLGNGQVLTGGDPRTDTDMNYTKAIGFNRTINSIEDAAQDYNKRLLIEMDTALIQSSQLEIKYEVKVKNLNEIDYDYGIKDYYEKTTGSSIYDGKIYANITKGVADSYITTEDHAKYYYYGDERGLQEMKATIEFIDYLKNDLIYKDDEIDAQWDDSETATQLLNNGYISGDVKNAIENDYYIFRTKDKLTLARNGEDIRTMTVSKVLANKNKNVFDNNVEIIEIDGKTARTIKAKIPYKPGNYVPQNNDTDEIDDDQVDVIITPPTGITNNIIIYSIGALFGLVAILVTVIFIKKKVLSK